MFFPLIIKIIVSHNRLTVYKSFLFLLNINKEFVENN